jgi:hypothetical protein
MKKFAKIFIFIGAMIVAMSTANAQLSVSITVNAAPPALPEYVQPPCPDDGYMWVPGYWAYDNDDGYYWVPGVWVLAPQSGYLWTPAYWGYSDGGYGFHPGYWGLHVGFYGGINYGHGYSGYGYGGGRWEGEHFRYNTAVVNVNTTVVHNTYIDNTVVNNTYVNNHTSFNGPGGVNAQPRPEERTAMNEQHVQPTGEQASHQQAARTDKNQFASVNNGHPAAAAMTKVGGRPINEQGNVAANSTLGHNGAQLNSGARANMDRHISTNKPANNPGVQQQHAQPQPQLPSQPQQRTQQQPQQHAQPQLQQRAQPQPQQRAQLQPLQHAQPQRVVRPQPQQHSQPQRVVRPQQQPHNNPKPQPQQERN